MYIGIDVGTGSARACLMDETGEILAVCSQDIQKWEPKPEHINQSSSDIWKAVCKCTRGVIAEAGARPEDILGIAYDATCSLVVLDSEGKHVPVGPDFDNAEQDVILWMDHRAPKETRRVKETQHPLLKFVGGQMSIEMEVPKMMWLKQHMPAHLWKGTHFYDLPDWLCYQSTGIDARSFCSVTCKQGYVPQGVDGSTTGWSADFFRQVGLDDIIDDDFKRMGGVSGANGIYHSAGEPVGRLTPEAARDLGLTPATVVGSPVIDAYSGWIGTVAAKTTTELPDVAVESRLAAVAGTSTCHIVQSEEPVFVPGVWGPYRDALMPGMWCAEGGQSTTGELLRHLLATHPAKDELFKVSEGRTFDWLNRRLEELRKERGEPSIYHLAKNLFWYGDLYGNRSPIADPAMRGAVVGLSMDSSLDDLVLQYLAMVEFICQQTRQIIDRMNDSGHHVRVIYLSGGQCRNTVLTELMATCTGKPLVIPRYIDSAVVLGTAMLAARAAHPEKSLWDVMSDYSHPGHVVQPVENLSVKALLEAKYKIFLDMADRQRLYRQQVSDALAAVSA